MTTARAPMTWTFPLPRTHTGMPLANGTQGLLVWGGDKLHITIGRAGFWDHRGGNDFQSTTTFHEVRSLLEAGDEDGLRRVFGMDGGIFDAARPHQVGGGRLEISFPAGWSATTGSLDLEHGTITVGVSNGAQVAEVVIRQAVDDELAWIDLPAELSAATCALRPSWQWIENVMTKLGCSAPRAWADGDEQGFVQDLPEDLPLAIAVRQRDGQIRIASDVSIGAEVIARQRLDGDVAALSEQAVAWWQAYWAEVPRVALPDPVCQEQVEFGLYLQACSTPPQGIACTLQGPFLEEYQLPPWSCDYHFNINIQMIYQPALASNRLSHFEPLWDLIRGWWPALQRGAAGFFADDEAIMLPHAVDDRCQVVGSFWTGSIDHGCTAWMALMAWDHCRYGADVALLREVAWPMLRGAFAGWWAMIDEAEDGSLSLPVSVSPEYKGARMDAWGRDASFQLAAAHATARALVAAADWLGETADPRWQHLLDRLPRYTTIVAKDNDEAPEHTRERIALWGGQDLDGSHRHHSHLAGITPFKTIDPSAEADAAIVRNSLHWWTRRGPGGWSGWCTPWAAQIHARCGNPDGALAWLHLWDEVFTNEGRGSLHDADFPGLSTLAGNRMHPGDEQEIMQLDGRFGAVTGVFELLVQDHDDEIRVVPRVPRDWRAFEFDGIRAPGAFLVGATVSDRALSEVRVTSLAGRPLRLRHGWDAAVVDGVTYPGQVLELATVAGQDLVATPA